MTINVDEELRKLRKPELKFDVRTTVQIIKNADRDGYRNLSGCVGEIIKWTKHYPITLSPGEYYYQYRVRIQGRKNKYTDDGAFIFTEKYLSKIETTEGGNKMLLKGYKVVGVEFDSLENKTYYFASYEKGLKKGDIVCVHTRYGFRAATISALDVDEREVNNIGQKVTEQVVCKINTKAYEDRVRQAERIQELEKVLDQKLKDAQKLAIFEMFSKNDEEFAKLLSEYKSLTENK